MLNVYTCEGGQKERKEGEKCNVRVRVCVGELLYASVGVSASIERATQLAASLSLSCFLSLCLRLGNFPSRSRVSELPNYAITVSLSRWRPAIYVSVCVCV